MEHLNSQPWPSTALSDLVEALPPDWVSNTQVLGQGAAWCFITWKKGYIHSEGQMQWNTRRRHFQHYLEPANVESFTVDCSALAQWE